MPNRHFHVSNNIDLLRARPQSIAIEVTSRCNLRCCYCHKADPVLEADPEANADMSDEMIAGLYRYCKAEGVRNVTLSVGGETTMVAGWHKRIAQFLDDPDIETHMVSNFVRPLSEEELVALCRFDALQISFDSSDLAMVRKLRSKADLRTITYNTLRLRQKGRELGRCPFLVVNCTLCRDNVGHIGKLAGFCRELGVDQLLLTEVMSIGEHNPNKPEMLASLSEDEVLLLAREIAAAENALSGSATALRLQEHLQARIGELIEQVREGTTPADAGSVFHRRLNTSACLQPWNSPMVRAAGTIIPCCGTGTGIPTGTLASQSMDEIMNGDAVRAIRAAILQGRPTVQCETCSFALAMSFPEFTRHIREWMGDENLPPYDAEMIRTTWPGLMGSAGHDVVVENARLNADDAGAVALIESQASGYHRVFFSVATAEYSNISFRARPAGRRRLRLDFSRRETMVGRAHIVFSQQPKVASPIGPLTCVVTPAGDRWYEVKATLSAPRLVSELAFFLMRENDAVNYSGDGKSGLEIAAVSLG